MFIYVDKENAMKGLSHVFGVSEIKIDDYEEYFEGKAVEYEGNDLPHHIYYDEFRNTIREATLEERVQQGTLVLEDNQHIEDNRVVTVEPELTWHERVDAGLITIDIEFYKARNAREYELGKFDMLEKNYLMSRENLTQEELDELDVFRTEWLNITEGYENLYFPLSDNYPDIPERLKPYLEVDRETYVD